MLVIIEPFGLLKAHISKFLNAWKIGIGDHMPQTYETEFSEVWLYWIFLCCMIFRLAFSLLPRPRPRPPLIHGWMDAATFLPAAKPSRSSICPLSSSSSPKVQKEAQDSQSNLWKLVHLDNEGHGFQIWGHIWPSRLFSRPNGNKSNFVRTNKLRLFWRNYKIWLFWQNSKILTS